MSITLTDPKQLTPTFYSLIHYRHQCKGCGNISAHSEVYAMVQNRGSGFTGIPCHSSHDIQYNLNVRVETRPLAHSPFCHSCWRPGMLNNLPHADPQKQKPQQGSPSWVGMGLKDTKPPKPKKPSDSKQPRQYTIDDLDID